MDNTVGSLTQEQNSIIIGSLLGDGYLRIVPNRKNALFEVNHSYAQKDYVDWKYQKLKNITKSPPKARSGNAQRIAYRFFTRQHSELTKFYRMFYNNGKKIIPQLELNPLVMAVWFMDDGSKSYKTFYLNTQQFDFTSQQKIIGMLKDYYGINSALNKDKNYYRIRIKQDSAKKFREIIVNYVISSMAYKLG